MKYLLDPDSDDDRGGNLLTAIVMRMIMSTGTAIMLTGAFGVVLCSVQDPINLNMCIRVTGRIADMLLKSGMIPQVAGVLGGISFFWISGKWHLN